MELILLRHPETLANKKKVYIGQSESDYSDKGKRQFNNILENFNHHIDYIYTSPMNRCKLLAKKLSEKLDMKYEVKKSLNEINFGIFEGKNYKDIEKSYPDEWQKWTDDYINYPIPQGESLMDLYKRVEEFLKVLKKKDGKYLLVTHGGVIQTIITILLDLDIEDRWHFKISEAGLVEISYRDGYGVMKSLMNY